MSKNGKKKSKKRKEKKVEVVMSEFKEGSLRSGSKQGPKVTNPKQAIAIALNSARKQKGKAKQK